MIRNRLLVLLVAPLALTACESTSEPDPSPSVAVALRLRNPPSSSAGAISITGSNGVLTLTDVRVIVSEFELEQDGACSSTALGRPCLDFEAPPKLLDLPLDGAAVGVVQGQVPPGSYDELEFEVEDLELDPDEPAGTAERKEMETLAKAIRAQFTDWPARASMVATGSFRPAGSGTAVPFRVYFDAETDVLLRLTPPVVLDSGSKTLRVVLGPVGWFRGADGRVLDLSQHDFARTGSTPRLGSELEEWITVEVDG